MYSIGLTAFVVIAQLAPSFFIGLFWNRGASKGAIIGIIGGFLVAFYTLLLPFTIEAITGDTSFVENGLFSVNLLKPHALFGIDFLSPAAHAFFLSFSVNIFLYIYFSLNTVGNYRERNYAEMFVDSKNFSELQDGAYVWKGEAYVDDIRDVLNRFLGINKTEKGIVGDVNFDEVSKVAKALTPVPGGVGPMTIACLLKNTIDCFKRSQN